LRQPKPKALEHQGHLRGLGRRLFGLAVIERKILACRGGHVAGRTEQFEHVHLRRKGQILDRGAEQAERGTHRLDARCNTDQRLEIAFPDLLELLEPGDRVLGEIVSRCAKDSGQLFLDFSAGQTLQIDLADVDDETLQAGLDLAQRQAQRPAAAEIAS